MISLDNKLGNPQILMARLMTALRVGVELDAVELTLQRLYERWLKNDEWVARSEALPLVVGVDPERWQTYLKEYRLVDEESAVWRVFAAGMRLGSDQHRVVVSAVYDWARNNGVALPLSFARLYDFVRQVTLRRESDDLVANDLLQQNSATPTEHEIVLGAALSLVAKMPQECHDEHGSVDATVVSKLIMDKAARWFPTATPSMSQGQIAELIGRWLE